MVSRGKSGEVHLSACYHADKIAKESLTYLDIYPAPELKTPDTLNLPTLIVPRFCELTTWLRPSR